MVSCSKYVLILGSADNSVPSTEMATPRESFARPKVVDKEKVKEAMPATSSVSGTRAVNVMPLGMSSLLELAGRCLVHVDASTFFMLSLSFYASVSYRLMV